MKTLNSAITEQMTNDRILELAPHLSKEEVKFIRFMNATPAQWEDWRWQLKNRIKNKETLSRFVRLTKDEEEGIAFAEKKLTMSVTPYFASLMDPQDPNCPIRRQSIPSAQECAANSEELADPCGEDKHMPVHGLVHRYPDRVLFLVSEICAMYCRFCTRSRMVGHGHRTLSTSTYDAAFKYIRKHKEVRDVLISGGDPLMLGHELLEHILQNIRAIDHVDFIRIGSRVPVTLPQRINERVVRILKRYGPIWMSLHFNHPKEITPRVKAACSVLADNGILLGSQTVLLKGINDDPAIMKKLMHELLKIRVKPYYIYQCDPILGSQHFRTPLDVGINMMENLIGHTTGYAIPTFVVDAPKGGGKIPVGPNFIVSKKNGKAVLRNFEGTQYTHQDPR